MASGSEHASASPIHEWYTGATIEMMDMSGAQFHSANLDGVQFIEVSCATTTCTYR